MKILIIAINVVIIVLIELTIAYFVSITFKSLNNVGANAMLISLGYLVACFFHAMKNDLSKK